MKNYLFTLLCCAIFSIAQGQTDAQIDSLAIKMCTTLTNNNNLTDSLRVQSAYDQHLPQFFKKFSATSDADFQAKFDKIYYRYQKNCHLLLEILKRNSVDKGDFKLIDTKPKMVVSKKKCRQIEMLKKFYYNESDGDKVKVIVENGMWIEEFPDGTFSKLTFKWTADCEFDLVFIESNNKSRKSMSSAGDTYHYGIFNTIDNDYEVWINDTSGNAKQSFRLRLAK